MYGKIIKRRFLGFSLVIVRFYIKREGNFFSVRELGKKSGYF